MSDALEGGHTSQTGPAGPRVSILANRPSSPALASPQIAESVRIYDGTYTIRCAPGLDRL